MGFKNLFNSLFRSTHYRIVNAEDYARVFASKDASVSRSDGRSITSALTSLLPPDRTRLILDVGANKGGTYRLFRNYFPHAKIIAFEPDNRVFVKLQNAMKDDPMAECHAMAVSNREGKLNFNQAAATECSSLLSFLETPPGAGEATLHQTVSIEGTTLDAFARKNNLDQVDLLKLDIEGAEIQALEGAKDLLAHFRIRCLYIELNFAHVRKEQVMPGAILEYMWQHSYQLYDIYNFHHDEKTGALIYCDGIFIPKKA